MCVLLFRWLKYFFLALSFRLGLRCMDLLSSWCSPLIQNDTHLGAVCEGEKSKELEWAIGFSFCSFSAHAQ